MGRAIFSVVLSVRRERDEAEVVSPEGGGGRAGRAVLGGVGARPVGLGGDMEAEKEGARARSIAQRG